MKLSISSRVAAQRSPILGPHIPAGVTGKVVEKIGCRAYSILFDGASKPVTCLPEDITCIALSHASVSLPPRPKLAQRGRFVNKV